MRQRSRAVVVVGALLCMSAVGAADAQTRPARRPVPTAPPVREPAQVDCPNTLGEGATTGTVYCDVLTALDPADGVRITLPSHRGEATLLFDLHNRQTYSEQQVEVGRAFARYTASVRVVSGEGEEIAQIVVQSEFRSERDLVERILGGAGPGGLKAVAPTGTEPIVLSIPEAVTEVFLVGQRLVVETVDRRAQYGAPGRPIASVSNLLVEYRPAPTRAARPARGAR